MFFQKHGAHGNMLLELLTLAINNTEIKRETRMKFLRVIINENISWKYIDFIQNKNLNNHRDTVQSLCIA